MLIETVVVTRVDEQGVWVRADEQGGCGSCSVQKGCGQSLYAKYFAAQSELMLHKEHMTVSVDVGDRLEIGLQESAMLKASLLVYMAPLSAFILVLALGSASAWPGWLLACSSVTALFLSACLVSSGFKRLSHMGAYAPQVISRLKPSSSVADHQGA